MGGKAHDTFLHSKSKIDAGGQKHQNARISETERKKKKIGTVEKSVVL